MRVLVTIPHYCRRDASDVPGFYGSESGQLALRREQVAGCILALSQCFGPRQALMGADPEPRANASLAHEVDVVLVTTGSQHLVEELPRPLFHHCPTEADPRCLGFVCHSLMREHAGRYDWFVFLEDDIAVADPLFFAKLGWFAAQFGEDALLQPNRFELSRELSVMKLYVDGVLLQPEVSARYQDLGVRPRLEAEAFGQRLVFKRVGNAHSGCFFVNAAQLARLAARPDFGVPTGEFFGPLESAATLTVIREFAVYKPALDNAAFLEVEHLGRRFLMPPAPEAP